MLAEILRFNRLATALAAARRRRRTGASRSATSSTATRFGETFRDWYFLPMIGCIWSCPTDQMLRFPVATLIRFCHNHGLLQVSRPAAVAHRARRRASTTSSACWRSIPDARLNTPVRSVRRLPPGEGRAGVLVATDAGSERFDDVVLACHSDQSLALLADADAGRTRRARRIRYHPNRAVLHTDARVLPRRRRAWAAWNYERAADARQRAGGGLPALLDQPPAAAALVDSR